MDFCLSLLTVESLHKLLEGYRPKREPSSSRSQRACRQREILAQFRKLMPEPAVRQIYTAVVVDLGKRIDALGVAIAKGDTAEVRRIGHAIKGGCGMAGALQAAHLGALLEAAPARYQR